MTGTFPNVKFVQFVRNNYASTL